VGTDDRPASHVDVTPTLLEVTGVTLAAEAPALQGVSLLGAGRREAVYGETNAGDLVNPQADARMVLAADHKYVYRPGDTDELYDLARDPEELRNVADGPDYQTVRDELRGRLRDWMRETEDQLEWR
jgi:arylsulfatase A-like enzyme